MRITILLAMLVNSGAIAASCGYTIPLAEGNYWVYSYSYRDSIGPYFSEIRSTYDTTRIGLFKITIDSLLNRNDSMFFSVTTIDSGKIVSKTIDSIAQATTDSISYYHRHNNRFLVANDSNFILDSLEQWKKAGWQVDTVPWGVNPNDHGTSWDLTGPSWWPDNPNDWDVNAVPWFLNYLGPTNSSFRWDHQNMTGYSANQRLSDSSYPATINGINYWCYTTGIIDSYINNHGPSVLSLSMQKNSIFRWIKDVGYVSYSEDITIGLFGSPFDRQHAVANWTLLSFNDNPVTLPSKVILTNSKQSLLSNKSNPYRKAFLLEGRHQQLNSSSSDIYNIRGQQLGKIQRAQIIIIKDR